MKTLVYASILGACLPAQPRLLPVLRVVQTHYVLLLALTDPLEDADSASALSVVHTCCRRGSPDRFHL